jgi:hypothetical protein
MILKTIIELLYMSHSTHRCLIRYNPFSGGGGGMECWRVEFPSLIAEWYMVGITNKGRGTASTDATLRDIRKGPKGGGKGIDNYGKKNGKA